MKLKDKLSAPMLAAIGAGVFVVLLALAYLFASGLLHKRDTGIELSSAGTTPIVNEDSQLMTAQSVADVEIGTQNAKQVIASLTRPEHYSCEIENTLYYQGGSSVLYCRQYVLGGAVRTDTLTSAGSVQSTLLRDGDTVYAWNVGENQAYQGLWGDFTDDAAAMLPTYEDVLAENVALTAAGRENIDYDPCIRVEFEQNGYRCVYHISAATGLLKQAAFYSGDTLARLVKVNDLATDAPDDTYFKLPNGQSILGENH